MVRVGGVEMPGAETALNDTGKTRHLLLCNVDL